MKSPFIKVEYNLFDDKELKDTDRIIFSYILKFYKDTNKFNASNGYIAAKLKKPISTISKHLKRLEDKGYIKRNRTPLKYGGMERTIVPLKYCEDVKPNVQLNEKGISKQATPIKDIRLVDKNTTNKSSDKELTPDLIQEMKKKYVDKDIDKAVKSFFSHDGSKYLTKDNIEEKFRTWCENEHPDTKKIIEKFRLDTTGNFYVAYCGGCTKSDFYEPKDLTSESRCCQNKLHPIKPN